MGHRTNSNDFSVL